MTRLTLPLALLTVALAAAALQPGSGHGQQATTQRIDTVAGPADLAEPSDVAVLTAGGYLIADTANNAIRRVDAAGAITTVATDGLSGPRGISPIAGGAFLIADTGNSVIRRVAADGTMTIVAGSPGKPGFSGDGGAATSAQLNAPLGVAALPDGGFLIADSANNRIRRVSDGAITTVAGTGTAGAQGDGGPATSAALNQPARVVALAGGGFLIADTANSRIRRVDTAGAIATLAGPTAVSAPQGIAVRSDGAITIADTGSQRIREIATDGTVRTVAGTGFLGFSGDGGPPPAAQLSAPRGVAHAPGGLLIADTGNNRIRQITTVAVQPDPDPQPQVLPQPDPTPPPGVAPPRVGRSTVVAPLSGTVRVRLAGRHRFTTLRGAANVGIGTELDTTRGTVALFFQTTAGGKASSAVASLGRFVVLQPAGPKVAGERPGLLVLSQPLRGCTPVARATATAAAAGQRQRKVRVRARGKIRTKGKYGSAIVLGTQWTIADRCPRGRRGSTTVRVTEGVVSVRDFVRHRSIRVPRGRSYTARARR